MRQESTVRSDKKMKSTLNFNSTFNLTEVLILDCLGSDDLQTAKSTHDLLLDLKNVNQNEAAKNYKHLKISREKVENKNQFFELLTKVAEKTTSAWSGIIHIECHGANNKIEVGDSKEIIAHTELIQLFRNINIKSQCGLGLFFACCNGLRPYKIEDFHHVAPFNFCLSLHEEISAGELHDQIICFYDSLFKSCNIVLSAKKLPNFKLQQIELIYLTALAKVVDALCSKKERSKRVETMITAVAKKYGRLDLVSERKKIRALSRNLASRENSIDMIIKDSMVFLCGKRLEVSKRELTQWLNYPLERLGQK